MSEIQYSKEHAWIKRDADGTAIVGISDFAQEQLGELVYVELPEIGAKVTATEPACIVESSKTADEVIAPVSGEVIAVNNKLDDDPETVNEDPTGEGWIFKIRLSTPVEVGNLIDVDGYNAYIEE
ncbi:MAG: glycine cleavage system protein GcvH [Halopseudomonas sp.]